MVKGPAAIQRLEAQNTTVFALGFQHPTQQFNIFGDLVINRFQLFDFTNRVNDRCVITPAEPATDFRQ